MTRKDFMLVLLAVLVLGETAVLVRSGWYRTDAAVELTPGEWKWLATHGDSLTISSEPYYPPVAYVEDGQITGLISDYYALLEQRLNITFRNVPSDSFSDMLDRAMAGEIDIIAPVGKTEERARHLLFTQPILTYPAVILVDRDRFKEDLSLDKMGDMKIALTEGYAIWNVLKSRYPHHRFVSVDSDFDALQAVTFRQADAAITDIASAYYMTSHWGFGNLRIAGQAEYTYVLSFASPRHKPILNDILIKALNSISEEDRRRISDQWLPLKKSPYFVSPAVFVSALAAMGLVILAVLLLSIWSRMLRVKVNERTAEIKRYQDNLEELVDERTRELSESNRHLSRAIDEVHTLSGFIPICASCKKIRTDEGFWDQVEEYISRHSNIRFSHGICPECASKLYPDMEYDDGSREPPGDDDER